MFLPIKKQLDLISSFLNMPEFKWKAIVNDNRMIPFLSWYKDAINEVKSLSSLEVILSERIWFSVWKWYPPDKSKLLEFYNKLSNKWILLDIEVVKYTDYHKKLNKSIKYSNILVLIYESSNIKAINKYPKIINFNKPLSTIVDDYESVIRWDCNDISANIKTYKQNYKSFLLLKKKVLMTGNIKYKNELLEYFIEYRLFEFKMRINFYKLLQNYWYITLTQVFNQEKINASSISYYKNISVTKNKYIWKIHNIYNIDSCNKMKIGDIMISKNTAPQFINWFMKASFICVETKSETTHAAITCKELKIPLALWCVWIRNMLNNWDSITIKTDKKSITL